MKLLFHIVVASKLGIEEYGEFINIFAVVNILILILGLELYTVLVHKIANKEWSLMDGLKHDMLFFGVIVLPVALILNMTFWNYPFLVWSWIFTELFLRNSSRYLVAADYQIGASISTFIQSSIVLIITAILPGTFSIWISLVLGNAFTIVYVSYLYNQKSQGDKIVVSLNNILTGSVLFSSFRMLAVGVGNRVLQYADRIFLVDLVNPLVFGQLAFLSSMVASLGMIIDPLIYQIRLPRYINGDSSTLPYDFIRIAVIVGLGTLGSLLIFSFRYDYTGGIILLLALVTLHTLIYLNNFFQFILYTKGHFNVLFISVFPLLFLVTLVLCNLELTNVLGILFTSLILTILIKYVYLNRFSKIL